MWLWWFGHEVLKRVCRVVLLAAAFSFLVAHAQLSVNVQQFPESGTPPAHRYGYCLVHHQSTNSLLLFGGKNEDALFDDMYSFDIAAQTWASFPTVGLRPSPRTYHTCHFVEDKFIYIFGGETANGMARDLWFFELESLTFLEIVTFGVTRPPAREYAQFFMLSGIPDHLFLHGGVNPLMQLSDTWVLSLATNAWTKVNVSGFPEGAYRDGTVIPTGPLSALVVVGDSTAPLEIYEATFDESGLNASWAVLPVASASRPANRYTAMRYLYNNKVHVSHGWSDEYDVGFSDYWQYDLATHEWESLPAFPDNKWRDSMTPYQDGNLVYYFGGWGEVIYNYFAIFDLDTLTTTVIHDEYNAPSPRSFHASAVLGSYFYTFGGVVAGGLESALWRLDLDTNEWERVVSTGTPPVGRHSTAMVSVGRRLLLFGGGNGSGTLGDLHVFNTLTDTWTEQTISSDENGETVAAPRQAHFMISLPNTPYIFISGGLNEDGLVEDSLLLNHLTNTFYRVNSTGSPPAGEHKGATLVGDRIIVVGGFNDGFELSEVWSVAVDTTTRTAVWELIGDSVVSGHGMAVAALGRYVVVVSGIFYDVLLTTTNVYEVTDNDFVHVLTLEDSDDWEAFGVAAVGLRGNSLYVFGGTGRASSNTDTLLTTFYGNSLYRMTLEPFCAVDASTMDECLPCSPGTRTDVSGCVECEPGTYSTDFGSLECTPCPAGYYSSISGVSVLSGCVPCPPDTYGDSAGLGECYPCPEDKVCTFATIVPGSESNDESLTQDQPGEQDNSAQLRTNRALSLLALVAGSLAVFFILLFIITVRWFPLQWQALDVVYNLSHYVASEGGSLKKHRTSLGGLFTVLLLIGIPFMCGYVLLPVSIQNTAEARTVVPNILVASRTIYTEINAVFSLNGYLGACEGGPLSGNPSLRACVSGLAGSHPGITSGRSESWTCRQAALDVCEVSYYCEACVLSAPNTEVRLDVSTDNSYASSIGWFLNTTAAMPARYSVTQSTLLPSPGSIFRGSRSPSIVRFSSVPVVYHVVFNETYNTGSIMSYLDSSHGSQVSSNSFHSANGLAFVMAFEKTTTTLNIEISNQLKVTVVLAAILGAVSAVVGGGAFVLKQTERALALKKYKAGIVVDPLDFSASDLQGSRFRPASIRSVVLGSSQTGGFVLPGTRSMNEAPDSARSVNKGLARPPSGLNRSTPINVLDELARGSSSSASSASSRSLSGDYSTTADKNTAIAAGAAGGGLSSLSAKKPSDRYKVSSRTSASLAESSGGLIPGSIR